MEIPVDLCLKTITKYINPDLQINAICSGTPLQLPMTVKELIAEFDVPEDQREYILNMISLEFAVQQTILDRKFKVPEFVRRNSMTHTLHNALDEEIGKIERVLKEAEKKNGALSEKDKKKMLKQLLALKNQKKTMPKYQKFLLISMAGSFTDVHVDLSATSVFYHVVKGRKIFYIAKGIPESLELYKKFEKKEISPEEWIGTALKNEWKRVEIKEGETAMIPSGYIHFVYTPEDSVVIGGNFLLERFAGLQFDLTTVEEDCLKMFKGRNGSIDVGNMFQGFRNVMWSYLEHCMLPKMATPNFGPRHPLYATAQIFLEEMDFTQSIRSSWYSQKERQELENNLRTFMGVLLRAAARREAEAEEEEEEGHPRAKRVKLDKKSPAV